MEYLKIFEIYSWKKKLKAILVKKPSEEEMNDLQNPLLFEGDIAGIDDQILLRDEPVDATDEDIFNHPV